MHISQLVTDRSAAASLDTLLANFIRMTQDAVPNVLRKLEKLAWLIPAELLEVTP
jgi:hypothetical protein